MDYEYEEEEEKYNETRMWIIMKKRRLGREEGLRKEWEEKEREENTKM